MYAQGIVALFPCLEDPFSQHGYVSKNTLKQIEIALRNANSFVGLHVFIAGTFLRSREWFWIPCMAVEDHSKNNCRGKRCLYQQIS